MNFFRSIVGIRFFELLSIFHDFFFKISASFEVTLSASISCYCQAQWNVRVYALVHDATRIKGRHCCWSGWVDWDCRLWCYSEAAKYSCSAATAASPTTSVQTSTISRYVVFLKNNHAHGFKKNHKFREITLMFRFFSDFIVNMQ